MRLTSSQKRARLCHKFRQGTPQRKLPCPWHCDWHQVARPPPDTEADGDDKRSRNDSAVELSHIG
jgi:hypothetical protein